MAATSEYFFLIICLEAPFLVNLTSPLGEDLAVFFRSLDPLELSDDDFLDLDLFDLFDSSVALDPPGEF